MSVCLDSGMSAVQSMEFRPFDGNNGGAGGGLRMPATSTTECQDPQLQRVCGMKVNSSLWFFELNLNNLLSVIFHFTFSGPWVLLEFLNIQSE